MIESNRFDLPHSSVYAIAVVFILSIFLLDKLTDWCIFRDGEGFFQKLVLLPTGYLFARCSASKAFALSTNLYASITPEALQKEYKETEQLLSHKSIEYTK